MGTTRGSCAGSLLGPARCGPLRHGPRLEPPPSARPQRWVPHPARDPGPTSALGSLFLSPWCLAFAPPRRAPADVGPRPPPRGRSTPAAPPPTPSPFSCLPGGRRSTPRGETGASRQQPPRPPRRVEEGSAARVAGAARAAALGAGGEGRRAAAVRAVEGGDGRPGQEGAEERAACQEGPPSVGRDGLLKIRGGPRRRGVVAVMPWPVGHTAKGAQGRQRGRQGPENRPRSFAWSRFSGARAVARDGAVVGSWTGLGAAPAGRGSLRARRPLIDIGGASRGGLTSAIPLTGPRVRAFVSVPRSRVFVGPVGRPAGR